MPQIESPSPTDLPAPRRSRGLRLELKEMILEDLVLVIPRSVNPLELQVPLGGLDEHLRLDGTADLPCDDINSIPCGLSLEQVVDAVKRCLLEG